MWSVIGNADTYSPIAGRLGNPWKEDAEIMFLTQARIATVVCYEAAETLGSLMTEHLRAANLAAPMSANIMLKIADLLTFVNRRPEVHLGPYSGDKLGRDFAAPVNGRTPASCA